MIFLCAPYASTVEMESASRDLEEWGNMYNISKIKYCDYYGYFICPYAGIRSRSFCEIILLLLPQHFYINLLL